MRSTRALVAAAAIVLSYPLAVAVQLLFGRGTTWLAALVLGFSFPSVKVLVLLPFVWLLFGRAERSGTAATGDWPQALAVAGQRGRSVSTGVHEKTAA